ncbi:hypothetical protein FA95DRAFT_1504409 [Auriscalpium vulgare]|uniref:Uncharacterized protein n=1 Tax=Auriscalpium vulgare TaxID=40419 RepID=A0ACB8R5U5_9AGAM|nr:hypothetical protein FA95DRAFT_1504409 [Auriscalpium vulgare]
MAVLRLIRGICREGAEVYDADGRLVVLRAWSPDGPTWPKVNEALLKAVNALESTAPTFGGGKRGEFQAYYFGLHRGSQRDPMMSAYTRQHMDVYEGVQKILESVRTHVAGIFATNFPNIYKRYAAALDFVEDAIPDVRAAFYPFACFAFNVGTVVCNPHKDFLNFITGLCLIIPFGKFDHTTCCRLIVRELGVEFEVGAGIPILIPSAMYTHYNTLLTKAGVRQSFTAWTGGPVVQWADLNGRSVSQLSKKEHEQYASSLPMRLAEGLALFPVHKGF